MLFKLEEIPFLGNIFVSGKKFNSLSLFHIIFLYLDKGDSFELLLFIGDLYPFIRLFKFGGN